jgi:hypothetical protein
MELGFLNIRDVTPPSPPTVLHCWVTGVGVKHLHLGVDGDGRLTKILISSLLYIKT